MVIEYGNENWNWLYRPAAIPYVVEHGKLAGHAFQLIAQEVKNSVNMRKVVNGRYEAPRTSVKFLDHTPNADGLAISPSFLPSLDKATPDDEILNLLFKDDPDIMKEIADECFARNKFLSIYELNLHTTQGDAKAYERNRVVAGAASGSALAGSSFFSPGWC